MSATVTRTLMSEFGLDTLTREYRQKLAHELIDSLASENGELDGFVLSEEWKAELDRRIKEMDEHPERMLTWEQVKKELEADDE